MSCAKFELLIALYVEHDLAEAEAQAVESHLETCDGCREFAAGMHQSQSALKRLRTELVEDSVFEEVRREVLGEVARSRKVVAWPKYAIAAMLIVGLAASWLWRTRSRAIIDLQPMPPMVAVTPPPAVVPAEAPQVHQRAVRSRRRRPRPAPSFKSEPLVVKMITDDPQVVIYWLVDQNGG